MGLYRDNGKENGNYFIVYWDYAGLSELQPAFLTVPCN